MSLRYYANAPATTLAASCTNSATSILVSSVTGFPIQYPYTLILDRGTISEEAVSVTAAAGTTLTVTRHIDSTTAFAHSTGAVVEHGVTAQDVREPNAHINLASGVHGVAGAVVGTTDVQVVTNKDLTSGNTFPSSLATAANLSAHTAATAAHGATGAVVGTTNVQTLDNKTLTTPKILQIYEPTFGLLSLQMNPIASAVNYVAVIGAATGGAVSLAAGGTDTNIGINLFSKGTGAVTLNGIVATDISSVQTLTNKKLSTGSTVGAATTDISGSWVNWTPTLNGITIGNGTVVAKYMQVGKIVHFRFELTLGTTTTLAGANGFTLPVGCVSYRWRFNGEASDIGVNAYPIIGRVAIATSVVSLIYQNGLIDANFTSTAPFTAGSTDVISIAGSYEAL
jgi:hypothetical protein